VPRATRRADSRGSPAPATGGNDQQLGDEYRDDGRDEEDGARAERDRVTILLGGLTRRHDALIKAGVDVDVADKAFTVAGKTYPAGSYVYARPRRTART